MILNTKDVVLKTFACGCRNVFIDGPIDPSSLSSLKKDLFAIESQDNEILNANYRELCTCFSPEIAQFYKDNIKFPNIMINISSGGGEIYSGFGMYDTIKRFDENPKYDLSVTLDGDVASMATIVMLGCKKRIAAAHTSFLIHSASTFAIGKLEEVMENVKESNRIYQMCRSIYISNTKITKEQLDEIDEKKKDWWISAKDALKYGLITEIV